MRVKAQRVFKLGAVLLCVGFFIYSVVINTNDYTSSRLLVNFNQKWGENVDLRPKFIRIPLEIGNSSNSKLDGIVSRYRMIEMVDEPLFKKGEHLAPRAARSPFFFVHGHGGNYSQPDEMIAYLTNTLRRFGIRDAPIAAYTVDLKNEPSAFSDELLVLQAKYYAFAIEKLITMHNFQGDFEPPTEDDSQEIDELRQNVRQVSSILKGARHAGRRKLTLFSLSMGTVIPLLSLSFLRPEYLPFIDTVILLNPPLVHHPFNSWLEDTTVYQNIASFFERTGREQHKYFIDVISYTSGPYDTMVRPEMTSFEFMLKGLKERASPSWRFTNIASRETQDVYLDLQHNELMYDKHFLIKLSKFFISKHFGAVERAPPFFLEGLSPSNEIVLENEDLDEEDCSIVQLHEVTTRLPLRERRYKGPNCLALKLNENTSELHIASNIDPENIKFIVKSTQSAFEYAPEKGIARPVNFTSFRWQRSNGDRLFLRVKKEALRRDSLIYFEQDYSSNRPRFNFNVDSWSLFKTQELILSTKGDRSQFTLGVKTDFANKYLAVKLCVEPLSAAPKNTSSVNLNNLKPYALISFDKETPKPSLLFFDLHEKDCSYFEASESQMFLRGNLYIMSNAELPEVKITITLSPILYIQSLLRNNIKYALAALGFVANLFLFLQIVQQKTCSTLKGYLKVMITQSPLLLSLLILFNVAISFIYRQLFKTGFLGIDNPYYGPYYHFDVIDGVFAAIGSLVLFYMITICGMLVVKVIAKVAGYILTFLGFLLSRGSTYAHSFISWNQIL
eukprot:TRINITY_DN1670_c0_g1_i2.p1 TRINITY_DN1670_c0_g1~~TRINITY_DN1670_c0_g1_i2.p1  ORF type:complete len:788 (-),score=124.68 TRINITY_DN1670_c0_g1_i2:656-3019(-)